MLAMWSMADLSGKTVAELRKLEAWQVASWKDSKKSLERCLRTFPALEAARPAYLARLEAATAAGDTAAVEAAQKSLRVLDLSIESHDPGIDRDYMEAAEERVHLVRAELERRALMASLQNQGGCGAWSSWRPTLQAARCRLGLIRSRPCRLPTPPLLPLQLPCSTPNQRVRRTLAPLPRRPTLTASSIK